MLSRFSKFCSRVLGGHEGQPEAGGTSSFVNMRIRVGKKTSIGNYRDNNEDRLYANPDVGIYVVADGMGGQVAGEQASQLAVDLIPMRIQENLRTDISDPTEIREAIRQSVMAANNAILARGAADPNVQNMGTTVVLGLQRGDRMYVAHVGDSRAYRLREGKIERITVDHNLAQALYDAKTISKEELLTHRFRHVLWKYLGSKEAADGPDIKDFDVRVGDRLLLASDGLTGVVDDEVIRKTVYGCDEPQKCAEELVRIALDQGSKDNVTCVLIYFEQA
jgi:protein phosphatase